MGKIENYRNLEVWKLAMKIAKETYAITDQFPKSHSYVLVHQMHKSAISIFSNIAEGFDRDSIKEYIHHLSYAAGWRSELESQLIFSVELGLSNKEKAREIMKDLISLSKMLKKLINSLKSKSKSPSPVIYDL